MNTEEKEEKGPRKEKAKRCLSYSYRKGACLIVI